MSLNFHPEPPLAQPEPPQRPGTWVLAAERALPLPDEAEIGRERPLRALRRAQPPRQAPLSRAGGAAGPAGNGAAVNGQRPAVNGRRAPPSSLLPPPHLRSRPGPAASPAARPSAASAAAMARPARGSTGRRRRRHGEGAGLKGSPARARRQGDPAARPRPLLWC